MSYVLRATENSERQRGEKVSWSHLSSNRPQSKARTSYTKSGRFSCQGQGEGKNMYITFQEPRSHFQIRYAVFPIKRIVIEDYICDVRNIQHIHVATA